MANSAGESASLGKKFLIRQHKGYVYDKGLHISKLKWDKVCEKDSLRGGTLGINVNARKLTLTQVTKLPSAKEFVYYASVAYYDHNEHSGAFTPDKKDINRKAMEPAGFKFLSRATNKKGGNGYYGVAYINRDKRQIILSHRGTANLGALWTDFKGVYMNKYASQVSSAMTFAYEIFKFAGKYECELFFTDHSLGAWLAQITTFSTMYVTKDATSDHFVRLPPPYKCVKTPYTVAFDSPGASHFLEKMRNDFFPHQEINSQEINVDILPVEVYQFHPNAINATNKSVGTVYLCKHEKQKGRWKVFLGCETHSLAPIEALIQSDKGGSEGDDLVQWQVIHFVVSKLELWRDSWKNEENAIPAKMKRFSIHFFNGDEQEFLKTAKDKFGGGKGQFEGINTSDEVTANRLLGQVDGEFNWTLMKDFGESVVDVVGWGDRRDFIASVRQTVRCIRHGIIWWNPKNIKLPLNCIDRKLVKKTGTEIPLAELIAGETEKFVFLVDHPGLGKSVAMTQLDISLRASRLDTSSLVLRLNLNQVQPVIKKYMNNEGDIGLLSVCDFLKKFAEYIPLQQLQETLMKRGVSEIPVYLLLDGLDEVCPEYEKAMLQILEGLLVGEDNTHNWLFLKNVLLTSRTHFKNLIEDLFQVNSVCLVPLTLPEQTEFLARTLTTQDANMTLIMAQQKIEVLPETTGSLMQNPLMLFLYSQVCNDPPVLEEGVVDIFQLYSQFMEKKHQLYIVEKEEADLAKMQTKRRLKHMLQDNLKFYYQYAVEELIIRNQIYENGFPEHSALKSAMGGSSVGMSRPSKEQLGELVSYGIFVGEGDVRFDHRSYAEFFFTRFFVEERLPAKARDVLFRNIYDVRILVNVEEFLLQVLLGRRRAREREGVEGAMGGFLNISGNWLHGSDSKMLMLVNCLKGRLFNEFEECRDEILLGVDYEDTEIMSGLIVHSYTLDAFGRWIVEQDRHWVFKTVFGLNADEISKYIEGECMISQTSLQLIVALAMNGNVGDRLVELLSIDIIVLAVKKCDDIVEVANRVKYNSDLGPKAQMLYRTKRERIVMEEVESVRVGSYTGCVFKVERCRFFSYDVRTFENIVRNKLQDNFDVGMKWEKFRLNLAIEGVEPAESRGTLVTECQFICYANSKQQPVCGFCNQNGVTVIEDMFHVLFGCERYLSVRQNCFEKYELPSEREKMFEFLANMEASADAKKDLFKYMRDAMKLRAVV